MILDKDLQSIQEVRQLVAQAKSAEKILCTYSQEKLDAICEAVASACMKHAKELAEMAVRETGFGKPEDKYLKNVLGSQMTWDSIRDMKTVGILSKDEKQKVWEIGVPMGIVAALIPSTNPTSTVMYKALVALKAGNAIIFSPHPSAKQSITETYKIVKEAAESAGAPQGCIGCISLTTVQATETLLKHRDIGIILATGGEAMVRAAYSSGNPALGVGPGNGPSYIEKSANIPMAVKRIMDSKTFDNGTVCASEQSIITEYCIEKQVEEELVRQGAYFLNAEQSELLSKVLLRPNGTMNPQIVGKSAQFIADMVDIRIPVGTCVMVSRQNPSDVGKQNPYAREKLCPVLAYFVVDSAEEACELCVRILETEGCGHTMTLHTKDQHVVTEFALKKPVSRILVNTPGALGGVGATTGLPPALTLGCGAVGGSATSDNITPMNLINIRRVAYGLCELDDLKKETFGSNAGFSSKTDMSCEKLTAADIEAITRAVIEKLRK